jgi:hypothetical protein
VEREDSFDLAKYNRGRAQIPPEAYVPYRGRWVAFSSDGARIIADGATPEEMLANLDALGPVGAEAGFAYVPTLEEAAEAWL